MSEELRNAFQAVRDAENRLDRAEREYVDVAVLELTAAKKRLDILLHEAREARPA